MSSAGADVVICGAGIAGISAAYHLAVQRGVKNVLLVDERAPLSLTSDKSTECYRNWWPGPGDAMVKLMSRSIDLIEDVARASGNVMQMNRRGYLYATADVPRIDEMKRAGEEAALLGAGEMRVHLGEEGYVPSPIEGFEDQPDGSDLLLNVASIRRHFPYLSERTVAVLHARRCGWLSAQQLGMYMLERAKECGVRFMDARIEGVVKAGGRVHAVRLGNGLTIETDTFVIAAGPFLKQVGQMVGVDLPVFSELHIKVGFRDDAHAFPRSAPLLIWLDAQKLPWSDEERALFAESDETRGLLNAFPAGVHARPEGGSASPTFLVLWTYHTEPVEPVLPIHFDPRYPEIALRGLSSMLPSLRIYFDALPHLTMDGGYYTKTRENRPLIGPLPVPGAFVIAALSGYGVMAACAAGELLATHVTGAKLPSYAPAFALERYQDPAYQELLKNWGASGQL